MSRRTGHLVVGPTEHGVVLLAERLLAGSDAVVVRAGSIARADLGALNGCARVHLHVTDHLLGSTCEVAAAVFTDLVARLGCPVSVTLHDVPQPGDGPAFGRRAAAYRRIVDAAATVVVNGRHEAALLAELGRPGRATVIPLPVEAPSPDVHPGPTDGQVTVLGFLHPGKGHRRLLAAMVGLPPEVGLVALGRPADDHPDLVDELRAVAGVRGFRVTGFVPGAALPAALARAGVPVAPNPSVSASGSIGSWLTAGRRPLVPAGRHTDELLARTPGSLNPYRPAELPAALARALGDPASTWLAPGVRPGPSLAQVRSAYRRVWA